MIFNERNDPNQISNLIDFNSRDFKAASNFSSNYSEISDQGNIEKSFDLYKQEDINELNESQVSEYAIQRDNHDLTYNICTEYESQNSMFNLNFIKLDKNYNNTNDTDIVKLNNASIKENHEKQIFGMTKNESDFSKNIFYYDKNFSKKKIMMDEYNKYKDEKGIENQYKNLMSQILGSNKSNNQDLGVETNNSQSENPLDKEIQIKSNGDSNELKSGLNKKINSSTKHAKFLSSKNAFKDTDKDFPGDSNNLNSNISNSVNNSNNSKVLDHDPSVTDLIGNIQIF